jgi:Transport protein Avl9
MALSDGAHAMLEEYSYFTLLNKSPLSPKTEDGVANIANEGKTVSVSEGDSTLFGIACMRQIRSERLKRRSADVTRSSVQKAVVVVVGRVEGLGELRTRLGMVVEAWFAQEDFSDTMILKEFQESLARTSVVPVMESQQFAGLSLRELVHELREKTLVLVKCLLLQRKMLFFGTKCERLCLLQYALLSLMPGLLSHLEDCAHPSLSIQPPPKTEEHLPPRTNSRTELLEYMGQPLRVFGSGAFFGPYTPLQHLDILASYSTKSYVVGSTNSLLLQSQSRYADVLVNLDEDPISISILSPSLKQALQLSAADRRWIDFLTQTVMDTWDPEHPSRPKGHGYGGSEEAIRMQFEEYILSLCSCAAYQIHREEFDLKRERSTERGSRSRSARRDESTKRTAVLAPPENGPSDSRKSGESNHSVQKSTNNTNTVVDLIDADPAENTSDFGEAYLTAWRETRNYEHFISTIQGKRIFEIIEPRHPTAGGMNIEDVQRRLQQNLADLHLDERYKQGREQATKIYEAGRERWKEGMGKFWAEIDKRRDSSRSNREDGHGDNEKQKDTSVPATGAMDGADESSSAKETTVASSWSNSLRERAVKVQAPDAAAMQAAARENAAKAGAYLSSWGSWARDKGKEWNEQRGRKGPQGG